MTHLPPCHSPSLPHMTTCTLAYNPDARSIQQSSSISFATPSISTQVHLGAYPRFAFARVKGNTCLVQCELSPSRCYQTCLSKSLIQYTQSHLRHHKSLSSLSFFGTSLCPSSGIRMTCVCHPRTFVFSSFLTKIGYGTRKIVGRSSSRRIS